MNRREFIDLGLTAGVGLAMAISPVSIFAQQNLSLEARISQLQQEVQADPRNPDLHFELSKLYEEDVEKYYDESLSEFKVAVKRGLKGKTVIWNGLGTEVNNVGMAQLRGEKYDEAIKNFERAAVFNPNYAYLYSNFAMAYRGKKDFDEAIKYMKKAIDLDPSEPDFYGSIGMIYLVNKDFRLSILNLNRVMYLDDSSENKKAFFNIAQAYRGLGEYSNAIEALDQLPRDLRKNEMVKSLRNECRSLLKQIR